MPRGVRIASAVGATFYVAGASVVCLVRGHHWAYSHVAGSGTVDQVCTRCYHCRSLNHH